MRLDILVTITITGFVATAYLGIGMSLKEFEDIDLPFIKYVYKDKETSCNRKSKRKGRWIGFRDKIMCSNCNTIYADESWADWKHYKNYCPICGSYNKII